AKPYEKTGAEVGELYHGGKQKIKEISPEKFQARDYGFYGKGFYVTEAPHYAKTYGGQVTRLALKPEARVLESTLTPEQASPELIRDVKQALYDAGIAKARERGKEDAFKAEIESITDSPINWKNAVDRFAELQGYDVVKHGAGEIVVKTPSVLQVAKQTPEKAKPKPRPKPETAEEEAGRLAARGAPLPSPLAPTTGGPFTRLRRTVENFFRGTAEQFRRTPGLEFLGNAGLRHQDHLAARKGELTAAVPKVNTREVNEQVAKYWSDQLGPGPSRGAAPLPTHPEAARIVGEQRRLKAEIKARNQSLGIKNDPGDASEYPMMLSKETLQAHQKGAGPHWQRLKDDMVNEGIIPGGAPDVVDRAADQYLKKVTDEFNQGKSINKPGLRLPMSAYELRPGGFISWASHAGEKSALRDAYGSVKYTPPGTPPGVAGKNLFDRARERTKVPKIQRKIDIMEALAYGQSTPNAWSGIINASTNMVTGAYLGNVKSTGKNLLGAIAGNVARWPTSFLKMRAALNAIPEAKERGLLQNDLFDAMDDINHPTLMGEGAGRFASFMLKKHGYPAVEMIARAQGLVGAKDELRAARKAYGNNPKSRKALKFMAWAQRLGFSDPEALIQEAATGGPLADAFLRRAVNRVHGGYAYTDVPLYLSGEHGGLYRQFGKFMTEHTNMVYEDIVKPLLRTGPGRGILPKETVEVTNPATGAKETVKVPGEPLRAAMYLAAFAAAGGLWDFAEEAIWDKASDWEKWSAMFERLGKGEIEVLGDAFTKLGMAAVNLGTFGFAGSFGKAGYEYFTGKSDLEQIALDIPAAGAVKDAVAAVQDFLGRKDWTPAGAVRFSDQILSILSTYRAGKGPIAQALHANNLDVFNSDITAYKIDRANARASMRRMEDALGIERKPHITGVPATAKTALKDKLNDLVATGRLAEARGLIETEKKKLKDDKTKEELMDDLKASTEAKHPLGPGKARRELLMEKAKKLMTPGEYERVKRIQKEYEKNAIKMDLMEDKGASSSQKQELEDKLERQRKQKLYEPSMVEELMSAVGF
ncbi:MAG TPA: hypothetical protein VFH87_01635, partial [Candidatus Udaeobacter sp.]|nr:hypothetical protein [Candidatus Udaeobacter sp.]